MCSKCKDTKDKGKKQARGKFQSNWNKLYNQAVVIN